MRKKVRNAKLRNNLKRTYELNGKNILKLMLSNYGKLLTASRSELRFNVTTLRRFSFRVVTEYFSQSDSFFPYLCL